jgi:hypothetical protein
VPVKKNSVPVNVNQARRGLTREVAPMFVVASDRFPKEDEETVLSCILPGQAHMNTNPTLPRCRSPCRHAAACLEVDSGASDPCRNLVVVFAENTVRGHASHSLLARAANFQGVSVCFTMELSGRCKRFATWRTTRTDQFLQYIQLCLCPGLPIHLHGQAQSCRLPFDVPTRQACHANRRLSPPKYCALRNGSNSGRHVSFSLAGRRRSALH